jgi:hypothetical protein
VAATGLRIIRRRRPVCENPCQPFAGAGHVADSPPRKKETGAEMMDASTIQLIIQENSAAHEQLARLVIRLTDEELSRPIEAGWTVAAALAHLAFWDARAVLLIEKWKGEGISPSPADTDIINDSAKILCLAIPPRAAAELAVRKSLVINRVIDNLAPEMIDGIQTIGTVVHLNRSEHKRIHMEEIERAVKEE